MDFEDYSTDELCDITKLMLTTIEEADIPDLEFVKAESIKIGFEC